MTEALHPLRFEPIFKKAIWGGDALRPMFGRKPPTEAEGEAWVVSDQGDNQSRVIDGPWKGQTLRDLMLHHQRELLGDSPPSNGLFPLLLKFLDARAPLSVQVHPNDEQARRLDPTGPGLGKTEAWLVLDAQPDSLLYTGLRPGITAKKFREALTSDELPEVMHAFHPQPGDCLFLEAGTLHAIGAGLLLFEVQQTSDITYRLYDWGRIDAKTGLPRQLHIEQALACTNVERGACKPVNPVMMGDRERLVECRYFTLDRIRSDRPFAVGQANVCKLVVCVDGSAEVRHAGGRYPLTRGGVLLFPASIGPGECIPSGNATILECGIP